MSFPVVFQYETDSDIGDIQRLVQQITAKIHAGKVPSEAVRILVNNACATGTSHDDVLAHFTTFVKGNFSEAYTAETFAVAFITMLRKENALRLRSPSTHLHFADSDDEDDDMDGVHVADPIGPSLRERTMAEEAKEAEAKEAEAHTAKVLQIRSAKMKIKAELKAVNKKREIDIEIAEFKELATELKISKEKSAVVKSYDDFDLVSEMAALGF
jgi:hypothetical protein